MHLAETLVGCYRNITGDHRSRILFVEIVSITEMWVPWTLAVLPAWLMGELAFRLESRHGWPIAAFLRAALLGLAFSLLTMAFYSGVLHGQRWGPNIPASYARQIVLYVAFPILCGLIRLSWSRSKQSYGVDPRHRSFDLEQLEVPSTLEEV